MSEAQFSKIQSKAASLETAKLRVSAAQKGVEAAFDEKNAADSELKLRVLEYETACREAVGLVNDPASGSIITRLR